MNDALQHTLRVTKRLRFNLMLWRAGQCVCTPTAIFFPGDQTLLLVWLRFSLSFTFDPVKDILLPAKKTYEKMFLWGAKLRLILEHRGDITHRTLIPALFYVPVGDYAYDWTFSWWTSGITLRIRHTSNG